MSRIGHYEFFTSAELHLVSKLGDTCPVNDEAVDTEIEVKCVLHCDDPEDGVSNVADIVLRKIWKKFHEHEIEIPFPQRDLHIKNDLLRVQVKNPDSA